MPSAHESKAKGKTPRRSPTARSGDAIRVSAKDGESYAKILKAMKVKAPKIWEQRSSPSEEPGGRRDPSRPEEGWRRLGHRDDARSGGREEGRCEVFGLEEDPRS